MEQEGAKMTFLKTLGFSLSMTVLFYVLIANTMYGMPLWALLLIFTIIGFAVYRLFRTLPTEDLLQRVNMIYIPGSIVIMFSGYFSYVIYQALKLMSLAGMYQTYARALIPHFSERNIPAELFLLLIGLFAPMYLIKKFKEKESVPLRQIVWSIICVVIIYCLVLWLTYMRSKGMAQAE